MKIHGFLEKWRKQHTKKTLFLNVDVPPIKLLPVILGFDLIKTDENQLIVSSVDIRKFNRDIRKGDILTKVDNEVFWDRSHALIQIYKKFLYNKVKLIFRRATEENAKNKIDQTIKDIINRTSLDKSYHSGTIVHEADYNAKQSSLNFYNIMISPNSNMIQNINNIYNLYGLNFINDNNNDIVVHGININSPAWNAKTDNGRIIINNDILRQITVYPENATYKVDKMNINDLKHNVINTIVSNFGKNKIYSINI